MLDDVERRYPARRYVMVDDKMRILAAMKAIWGDRLDDGVRPAGALRARRRAPRAVIRRPTSRSSASAIWSTVDFWQADSLVQGSDGCLA